MTVRGRDRDRDRDRNRGRLTPNDKLERNFRTTNLIRRSNETPTIVVIRGRTAVVVIRDREKSRAQR